MIDLKNLETLAKAATPGAWECDSLFNVRHGATGIVYRAIDTIGYIPIDKDAVYIAAANPATMLELIEELRAKNDLLEEIFDDCGGKIKGACPVCHIYTHKHWCWYPYLAKMLGKPLDENDLAFLAATASK